MSAQQNTGRVCKCGCGASLDDLGPTAIWARGCSAKKKHVQDAKRRWEANRRERRRVRKAQTFVTRLGIAARVGIERVPLRCKLCCDDPSNRSPYREADSESGYGDVVTFVGRDVYVVMDGISTHQGWVCRGCGEPYEAAPPIELPSLYHSSAAMAVDHGALHGYQGCKPQEGDVSLQHQKRKAPPK